MNTEDYMKEAHNLAMENAKSNFTEGGPFGAIVVKDGEIVGRGKNEIIKDLDPTSHAEVKAIRNACKNLNTYDLSGCVLYTSSYPCPMCMSSIVWANIKKVYYGNTVSDTDKIGFRDEKIYKLLNDINNNKKSEVLELISAGRDITIEAYKLFDENKDKIIY